MKRPILFHIGSALGTGLLLFNLSVHAQNYPTKPVRVVVAFLAGGHDDYIGRLIAPKLTEVLGQQVIVENRPGGGGVIGWEYVAKVAPPDGYTLALGGGSMTTLPSLRSKPPYDVLRDFRPISLISTTSFVLVVHPSVPARTVKELIALAREQPGKLNYASPGAGALGHLSAELLKSMAGLDIVHVPYKGAPPAFADLMAGRVDMYFSTLTSAVPHVLSGKVRALGVTSAKRVAIFPDVPTIGEAALDEYDISGWSALHGPAGVPRDVVDRLNAAIHKVVAMQDLREQFLRVGDEPQTNTPEQMAEMMRAGVEKFGSIIRTAGIKAD